MVTDTGIWHNVGRQHGRMERRCRWLGRDVREWRVRERALVGKLWGASNRCRQGRLMRAAQCVQRWVPETTEDELHIWDRSEVVARGRWRAQMRGVHQSRQRTTGGWGIGGAVWEEGRVVGGGEVGGDCPGAAMAEIIQRPG